MSLSKNISLALAFSGAGALITVYSYSVISLIADRYLLSYVYSNPMNEAVSSIDRFFGRINIVDSIAVFIGVIFLALGVYFAFRYVSRTTHMWRRMAAIVLSALVGFYAFMVIFANFFL